MKVVINSHVKSTVALNHLCKHTQRRIADKQSRSWCSRQPCRESRKCRRRTRFTREETSSSHFTHLLIGWLHMRAICRLRCRHFCVGTGRRKKKTAGLTSKLVSHTQVSVGLILAKASAMRISIPLDLSSRSFIPLRPLSFLLCVPPKRCMKGSYLRVLPAFLTLHSLSVTFFTLGFRLF